MQFKCFRSACTIPTLLLSSNYIYYIVYFFFLNVSDYLLLPETFGITISLTAFFDVLFFNGFVASKLNNSSLSTKFTNFSSSWIDSLSIAPTSLLKISVSRRSGPPVVFFGFINDRMSTFWFWVFLNYFLAISCFCILLIYLLVEGRRGI